MMPKNVNRKCFYTASLGCAATLVVSGTELATFELRAQGGRIFYVFQNYDQAKSIADGYWLSQLCLDPKRLFDEASCIKERLLSEVQQ